MKLAPLMLLGANARSGLELVDALELCVVHRVASIGYIVALLADSNLVPPGTLFVGSTFHE
jgi:hypothetical protein